MDQDPLGKQGLRISQTKQPAGGMAEVWTRQLVNHEWAILFFNRNNSAPLDIACDDACLGSMGLKPGEFTARNLNTHADIEMHFENNNQRASGGSARTLLAGDDNTRGHRMSDLVVRGVEKDDSVMMRLTPKLKSY